MLHELVRYAQREGLSPERGFKAKSIRWLLNFDVQGRFAGVTDCTGGDRKSRGRLFKKCPDLGVLAQGGGVAHFLADSLATAVLHTPVGEGERFVKKHDYFLGLLRNASATLPILSSIAQVLGDVTSLDTIRTTLVERKAKPIDTASIAIVDAASGDVRPLLDDAAGSDWWRDYYSTLVAADPTEIGATTSAANMLCILSGLSVDPAATHPKIESMSDVGGLSVGVSLASFDKEAFESYGLSKGRNAAMSGEQASIYTGALNDLLRNPERTKRLAGVKIAYWYAGVTNAAADDVLADVILPEGFDASDDDDDDDEVPPTPRENRQAESRAGKLLEAIRSGERDDLRDARFYAMTISANAGRVVIRDWMEGTFVSLATAVDQWFADLAIVSRDGFNIVRHFKLLALVGAGVRDLKDAQPAMEMSLLRSAIQGRPIASEIAAQTLRRAVLDIINGNTAQHRRFALMKAYLGRKGWKQMNEELNEDLTDPAYLCGRLMAVLSRIQQAALGDVGAGVVQRYYAAASATPALVLGRLIRTAQTGHLPKIQPDKLRGYFEKELAEIWSHMRQRPPTTLTLEEQTLFAMGYYQQQAKRNKPKDAPETPAVAEA